MQKNRKQYPVINFYLFITLCLLMVTSSCKQREESIVIGDKNYKDFIKPVGPGDDGDHGSIDDDQQNDPINEDEEIGSGDTGGDETGGGEDAGGGDTGDGDTGGAGNGQTNFPLQETPNLDPAKFALSTCEDFKNYLGLNDPYACHVWHLASNEQQVAKLPSTSQFHVKKPKKDFNLWNTYQNYTGQGIKVHVTDSGTEHTHVDLSANFTIASSRNYSSSTNWDSDKNPTPCHYHGTAVSGLIGAVGNNNVGTVGIAYNSTLSGDNLIGCAPGYSTYFIDAFKKDSSIDIWNGSFGIPLSSSGNFSISYYSAMNHDVAQFNAMEFGANQNNITYFKANGNDGTVRYNNVNYYYYGADGNLRSTPSFYMVHTIAAIDSEDKVVSYSTPGANLALSGYADNGGSALGTCTSKLNNSYTCSFNGTSSASPTVAGAAALVLEALKEQLPDAKWTDLIWMLISTSNPNITDRANYYTGSIGTQPRVSSTTNAFGLKHSFDHGFGVPNVEAAIRKVQTLSSSIPVPSLFEYEQKSTSKTLASGTCQSQIINIPDQKQVWTTIISVDIDNILLRNIGLFLKMPDGTIAQVKDRLREQLAGVGPNGLSYSQKFNVRAPMGINTQGNWEVIACSNSGTGFFRGAEVQVYGFDDINTLK